MPGGLPPGKKAMGFCRGVDAVCVCWGGCCGRGGGGEHPPSTGAVPPGPGFLEGPLGLRRPRDRSLPAPRALEGAVQSPAQPGPGPAARSRE